MADSRIYSLSNTLSALTADWYLQVDKSGETEAEKLNLSVITDAIAAAIPTAFSNRNYIVNHNFDDWQLGTSFNPTADLFTATTWRALFAYNTGRVLITQSTTTSDSIGFSQKTACTTTEGSLAASTIVGHSNAIHAPEFQDAKFGTANAEDITLTILVRASKTGTYCLSIQNEDKNRSLIKEYTINVADTFEEKTITFAADTSGTWKYDNNEIGIYVNYILASGSNFIATADTWHSSDVKATSNQVNFLDSTSNDFYFEIVKLEKVVRQVL